MNNDVGMQNNRITTPIPEELNTLTEKVIGFAYKVSNSLGSGFLEKVYENALSHEIYKTGLDVKQQQSLKVWYDGVLVGEYVADLIVEEKILVELKAVKALDEIHQAQCINYLRATGYRICLLINFGKPRVEVKRICL
jgi:GxxExxY protein